MMIELHGKYNTAKIMSDDYDETAILQIQHYIDTIDTKGKIRVMPDYHAGAGCTIGFTQDVAAGSKIIPNLIGVDIGCGMTAFPIGSSHEEPNFQELDEFIRANIPFGHEVNDVINQKELSDVWNSFNEKERGYADAGLLEFLNSVEKTCKKIDSDYDRVAKAIGSLGGGNHFISIDRGKLHNYLVVHSGSRQFGKQVAEYHQAIAAKVITDSDMKRDIEDIKKKFKGADISFHIKQCKEQHKEWALAQKKPNQLEWLEQRAKEDYYEDMKVAQKYAQFNRRVMLSRMAKFIKRHNEYYEHVLIESVHNYISFKPGDNFVRKGAISAHKDQLCVIPLSMADGILFCKGKGNQDWNYSAPHGAGRLFSRSKAKTELTLEEYRSRMKDAGVWSSCINKDTLDESPMAYKSAGSIIAAVCETVEILEHWAEVYNFKATE